MVKKNAYQLDDLIKIMQSLRDPDSGCPWDLKQTYQSIVPYTLEEAYEVADAIERASYSELKGELGDLLFQVIFYCQLATEEGRFGFSDVVDTVCEKLVRRHPHVFGDQILADEAQIKANWEAEKAKERQARAQTATSVLDDIPTRLPALSRAQKMQKRCAAIGFDWPHLQGALAKVHEELAELDVELEQPNNQARVEEELGDLMFALVNVSRHLKIDAEQCLRKASDKFETRFRQVETLHLCQAPEQKFTQLSLAEMEHLWQQAKKITQTK
ncbi:nucleoside triphosphate pyrophosphohydrolase [Gayadomonas joobiniege]|uniref:nucleoside triphosphate pyrophosphohydrolase n=1 Tax=Gayadomonas joobiniege TaxID=1234606 RepID=UPI00037B42C1|nr:nucleoside triphosphate pyrophosphohydrolase [Gayadomonas joobiniege]